MIYYILGGVIFLIYDKAMSKIKWYCIGQCYKRIKYRPEWHRQHDNIIFNFLDWVII